MNQTLPDVTLKEVLIALKDVLQRADMFSHHHIQRDTLSVRERMSNLLATLTTDNFTEFSRLFKPEEGRLGVVVTFLAILELIKGAMIELIQTEAYGPIHVKVRSSSHAHETEEAAS